MTRQILADRGDHGVRLDLVLARHLADRPDLSRTTLQRLVMAGRVTCNGRRVTRTSARVAAGWLLEVDAPDAPARTSPVPEAIPLPVVFEDEHLLVVDKPPGMVAHPAYRHERGTLLNALIGHVSQQGEGVVPRLVNRLDRDTSGLVLVSKHLACHARLLRAMAAGAMRKEYLAVVKGVPRPPRGLIDLPLGRSQADKRRVAVRPDGQESRTRYEVLARLRGHWAGCCVVRCRLLTGRTHQIRVHLSARGWPIIGDTVYGVPLNGFPRQALHAHLLSFTHPVSGESLLLRATAPPDLEAVLCEVAGEWLEWE